MRKFAVLLAAVAMLMLTITGCSDDTVSLTILQTSDLHDHAGGYGSAAAYTPLVTDDDNVLGGYARLAKYISGVLAREGADNVLLADTGDFTMGTVYTMTLAESPLAFLFITFMGYDAITLGNHELDLGAAMFAGIVGYAQANTVAPFATPILASNMKDTTYDPIKALVDNKTIVKSKIVEKASIKIGLLGILGANADFDAANKTPVEFDHEYATTLKAQVDELRAQGAKLVVLLSHEGFTVNSETGFAEGNDADLAKEVAGIDVILSGHLHLNYTAVKAAADVDTILVSPGAYGEHIARLDLEVDKNSGKIKSYTSANVLIDDTIGGDEMMNTVVAENANPSLSAALAPAFSGLKLDGVDSILDTVALNDAAITTESITTGFTTVGESVLGNLAADSYRNAINKLAAVNGAMAFATGDPRRVDIAFVPGGVIRDAIAAEDGAISFADLYNVVPLGGDTVDTTALGYPLLTTFIKGADIYKVIGLSIGMGMAAANSDYVINFAGIYVKINSTSPLSFAVYRCPIDNTPSSPNIYMNGNIPAASPVPGDLISSTDDTTLYKVAIDLYTILMMYAIAELPGGSIYAVSTYNENGSPAEPAVVTLKRVKTGATTTMRAWQAVVGWAAAASSAAGSLAAAGYTTSLPVRRIQ